MFLTITIWTVVIILSLYLGLCLVSNIYDRKVFSVSTRQFNKLSWPSQEIMKEYRELDEDYRPMTMQTLYRSLLALEVKHGNQECTNAFTTPRRTFDGYKKITGWSQGNYNNPIAQEFNKIRDNIINMRGALEERKKAAAIAGVEGDLSALDDLVGELQSSAKIVRTVTKEML